MAQEDASPDSDAPPDTGAAPSDPNPPASAPAPTPAASWVPQGSAVLQALDKVNAQTTVLTAKIGQTVTFGSLSITAKGCVVRPPDQPQDAAAFVEITDSRANQPGFSGWMLRSMPSLSMLEHPIYDVRIVGCGS